MNKSRLLFLLLALNIAAILFYFFIVTCLTPLESIPQGLFFTGDSREYQDYTQWLTGHSNYCNPVRPFFYPLLLLISSSIMGTYGPWIMHFIFWIVSCNLVFFSLQFLTRKTALSAIGFILCFTHLPLIGYSLHALTELTVFFLLAVLLYTISKNTHRLTSENTLLKILFIVSLLTATKPLYQIIWYATVLGFLFYCYRALKNVRILLFFLLAASPVLIQKSINIITHDTLSSTVIADSNLKKYLYRKIKYYVENGKAQDFNYLPDSIHSEQLKKVADVSVNDAILFLAAHPKQTLFTFIENLKENIGSGYPYVGAKNITISKWTAFSNTVLMYLHIAIFIMWLSFLSLFRGKTEKEYYMFILCSGIMLYYIYFTSGLVFWAGDRLIAPATSLWVCCYLVMGSQLYDLFTNKSKRNDTNSIWL